MDDNFDGRISYNKLRKHIIMGFNIDKVLESKNQDR